MDGTEICDRAPMNAPITDSSLSIVHIGAVVYLWGACHQDRFLLECLVPVVTELRRQGFIRGFLIDRYDARGPHIFTILTVPRAAAQETAARLATRFGNHLADHPSSELLTPEKLARRHTKTRLRQQCAVDGWPGFEANNSFEIFPNIRPGGYPFRLTSQLTREEKLWNLVTDLTFWTIDQLTARPGSPAMTAAWRWVASVEKELCLSGAHSADYWRYHIMTLLPDLFLGMRPEEETEALSLLASGAGGRAPAFLQAWQEVARDGSAWPGLPSMVRIILEGGPVVPSPWPLLREIDHIVLKQLGVPTALQIPLASLLGGRAQGRRHGVRNNHSHTRLLQP